MLLISICQAFLFSNFGSSATAIKTVDNRTALEDLIHVSLVAYISNNVFFVENEKVFLLQNKKSKFSRLKARSLFTKDTNSEPNITFTTFRIGNISESKNDEMIPVSHCHSEIYGHGGEVEVRIDISKGWAGLTSFGISPNIFLQAFTVSTNIGLDMAHGHTTKLNCNVQTGRVGQVFSRGTKFVNWTLEILNLEYDILTGKFRDGFDLKGLISSQGLKKHGIGEFYCIEGNLSDLQCDLGVHDSAFSVDAPLIAQLTYT